MKTLRRARSRWLLLLLFLPVGAVAVGATTAAAPATDEVTDITNPAETYPVVIFRNCGVDKIKVHLKRELHTDAQGRKTEKVTPDPLPPPPPAMDPKCADHKVTDAEKADADQFIGLNPIDRNKPPDQP